MFIPNLLCYTKPSIKVDMCYFTISIVHCVCTFPRAGETALNKTSNIYKSLPLWCSYPLVYYCHPGWKFDVYRVRETWIHIPVLSLSSWGRYLISLGLSLFICHMGTMIPIHLSYSHVIGRIKLPPLSHALAGQNLELSHIEDKREEGKTQPEHTSGNLIKSTVSHSVSPPCLAK